MGPMRNTNQASPSSSNPDPFEVVLNNLENSSLGASASSQAARRPPPVAVSSVLSGAALPGVTPSSGIPPSAPSTIAVSGVRTSRFSHAPPPSTRSAPLHGGKSILGGATLRGYINGKVNLFRYGPAKADKICGGYVGGAQGTRTRFCCKELQGGKNHCGDSKHSSKFALEPEVFYIPMDNESALTWPYLRMKDLIDHNSVAIVTQIHPSREWIDIVGNFINDNRLPGCTVPVEEENDMIDDDDISEMGESMKSPAGRASASSIVSSKAPAASVASLKAGSSTMWNDLRPPALEDPNLPFEVDEKWFEHHERIYKIVRDLHHSLNWVISELPTSFDAVNGDVERNGGVTYETYVNESLTPIQRLVIVLMSWPPILLGTRLISALILRGCHMALLAV
eukprot:scaffold152_cov52-Cyclotella_meneghiniana.AAC.3